MNTFAADRTDGIFALGAFVLGFLFARWMLFAWQGWGVTVFTLVYCGSVTLYLRKKEIRMTRAGRFWLTITVLTGCSYTLYANYGLEPWRSLFLFWSAVYWVISATGLPILGKTGNWIVLDSINAFWVIPFRNFGRQYQSLAYLGSGKKAWGKHALSVLLGILLAFIVGVVVMPLLLAADSGGFAKIADAVLVYFHWVPAEAAKIFFQGILAVPIAAYLFGLTAGCAHRRGVHLFKKDGIEETVSSLRVLPPATVYTLLSLVCALYVVFIGSQLPYFFSAFAGIRPEGWLVYSEYARRGFFELCAITALNLALLTAANLLNRKPRQESIVLKVLNCMLALLNLILIAAAFSKMTMYIGVYGLSVRRVLPCLFMIFLAVICAGVIALQKWRFSVVRLAAGVGAVMLCLLCLANPDGFVARYNAERYLAGTLTGFDTAILHQGGPAGVDAALKVFSNTNDQALKEQLSAYLKNRRQQSEKSAGTSADNLQTLHVRSVLPNLSLPD